MIQIAEIRAAIVAGRFRISDHAFDEAREDGIMMNELLHSLENGKIAEEYLYEDPSQWPRCLIVGRGPDRKMILSVWANNRKERWAALVTVYRPKSKKK